MKLPVAGAVGANISHSHTHTLHYTQIHITDAQIHTQMETGDGLGEKPTQAEGPVLGIAVAEGDISSEPASTSTAEAAASGEQHAKVGGDVLAATGAGEAGPEVVKEAGEIGVDQSEKDGQAEGGQVPTEPLDETDEFPAGGEKDKEHERVANEKEEEVEDEVVEEEEEEELEPLPPFLPNPSWTQHSFGKYKLIYFP